MKISSILSVLLLTASAAVVSNATPLVELSTASIASVQPTRHLEKRVCAKSASGCPPESKPRPARSRNNNNDIEHARPHQNDRLLLALPHQWSNSIQKVTSSLLDIANEWSDNPSNVLNLKHDLLVAADEIPLALVTLYADMAGNHDGWVRVFNSHISDFNSAFDLGDRLKALYLAMAAWKQYAVEETLGTRLVKRQSGIPYEPREGSPIVMPNESREELPAMIPGEPHEELQRLNVALQIMRYSSIAENYDTLPAFRRFAQQLHALYA